MVKYVKERQWWPMENTMLFYSVLINCSLIQNLLKSNYKKLNAIIAFTVAYVKKAFELIWQRSSHTIKDYN